MFMALLRGVHAPRESQRIPFGMDNPSLAIPFEREYHNVVRHAKRQAAASRLEMVYKLCPRENSDPEDCSFMSDKDKIDLFLVPKFEGRVALSFVEQFLHAIYDEDMRVLNDLMRQSVRKIDDLADTALYVAIRYGKKNSEDWIVRSEFTLNRDFFKELTQSQLDIGLMS